MLVSKAFHNSHSILDKVLRTLAILLHRQITSEPVTQS